MTKRVNGIPEYTNFRELLFGMQEDFPNWIISAPQVRAVIQTEKALKNLERSGYLIKTSFKGIECYSLGAASLQLINAWKMEDLTKKITNLTWLIFVLTILTILWNIFTFVNR